MDKRKENSMMAFATVILMVVFATSLLFSCRTRKKFVSSQDNRTTLQQSSNSRTAVQWADTLTKLFQFGADSIVITFLPPSLPPAPSIVDTDNASAKAPVHHAAVGNMVDNTHARRRFSGAKYPSPAQVPYGAVAQPPVSHPSAIPTPSAIKIYAPHAVAHAGERRIGSCSSEDSNDTSMQSQSEEQEETVAAAPFGAATTVLMLLAASALAGFAIFCIKNFSGST